MTYPQYNFQPPAPVRKRRAGLVILVVGLVLVVIIGILRGVQKHHNNEADKPAGGSTSSSSSDGDDTFNALAPQTLAKQLSYEIQTHNEKAFLSHMTGGAVTGAQLWWENMSAIGFDYGQASVEDSNGPLPEDGQKTMSFVLDLGVHSKLDPVTKGEDDGTTQYSIPATSYKVTLQAPAKGATSPLVSSWQGTSNAPWDSEKLYVVHTTHTVIAGPPGEKGYINSEAKVAEKAAAWTLDFFGYEDKYDGYSQSPFVQQKGFIAFVSADANKRAKWFSTSTKPRGWLADPNQVGGFFKPLPQTGANGDLQVSSLSCGGGYVVLGTKISGSVNNEGIMVHEFTHDLMGIDDVWSFGTNAPLPAWEVEGWARYIEAIFHGSPDNGKVSDLTTLSKPYFASALARSHPEFTGQMPSDATVYGSGATADYYYDLAATGYRYLVSKYQAQGFHAVLIGYLGGQGGPFGGILASSSHGDQVYYSSSSIEANWASWYRQTYGS